jgi:GNAT superfamily N-acetyltransferase
VNVTSLGYRTDLMIRRMEGSEITDCRDHIVVRSPAHPAYWWGNFLLLAAAPKARETAKWLARFAEVFPAAGHVALGIDTTQPDAADGSGLQAAGLRIERNTVMTAPDLREPPDRDFLADYRALAGEEDWRQSLDLRLAADEGGEFDVTRAFYEQRTADARRLAENGHGAWFGAFAGGRLVAQLGVFSDGSGIARYQNVETHPAWRRRGLAGTLVWHAGRWAFDHLGARTLAIVADPAAGAIRVYRSVGFADAETQIGFQRPPPAAGWGAGVTDQRNGSQDRPMLQVGAAGHAGLRAAAHPDRSARVAGDVHPAPAAERRALAGHIRRGGVPGRQQPSRQRRVEAAGHRILTNAAQGGGEGANLERLR